MVAPAGSTTPANSTSLTGVRMKRRTGGRSRKASRVTASIHGASFIRSKVSGPAANEADSNARRAPTSGYFCA